jgi:hypothetical protein
MRSTQQLTDEATAEVVANCDHLARLSLSRRRPETMWSQTATTSKYRIGEYDESIQSLVAAIRRLMEPAPAGPRRRIGF